MRSFALSVVAGILTVGTTAHGAVLCAKARRDGTFNTAVRIRESCKATEVVLNPNSLGFCCSLPTTTSTTTTSTTLVSGHCAFGGATCTSDADCGIPGVCYSGSPGGIYPDRACAIRCDGGLPCPPATFCFTSGLLGPICVGCGQPGSADDSKCAPDMVCASNDCYQLDHQECDTDATDCTIRERCVP